MPQTTQISPPHFPVQSPQDLWWKDADVKWFDNDGHIKAPKNYLENLRYRVWLRGLETPSVDDDCSYKGELLNKAKTDILFFFNTFLWTLDPRKRPSDLPFITYDYEDEYIKWIKSHIDGKKDCFTEKSRDMGISWCVCGIILHYWMFQDGFLAHIGSKKEDDVDRSSDIRSLFEKLRYLIRELPIWLRPYGFDWKKHSMFMRLINPMNNNSITGESSNRDFGRGGRYSAIVLDEFGAMEYADEAWTATGDSTPCRIVGGTPNGTGNKFWQLRFKSKIDIFTAHWTLHPEKSMNVQEQKTKRKLEKLEAFNLWKSGVGVTSPWYEAEINRRLTAERQSKVDIAQELDIDYLASGDPYFNIPQLIKQKEWPETEDWINFGETVKDKVIIGILAEIDSRLEFRPNKNGWLRLFEKPERSGQYCGALDAAEGLKGRDYSSGAFRNKKTRNLTAGIYGHFDYDELSYYGFLVSRYFNNCLICAEAGGYGSAVNKRLYDLGANVARAVDLSSGAREEKEKLGFITNHQSRAKMLGDLEADIREGLTELRDKDLKNECLNFVNNNGRPQAAEGSNDDYIFAFAIAGQLLRLNPYSDELEKQAGKEDRRPGFFFPQKNNMGAGFKK